MKRTTLLILLTMITLGMAAQMPSRNGFKRKAPKAATWTAKVVKSDANKGVLEVTMTPAKDWHVYGMDIEKGGPRPMVWDFSTSTGVTYKGADSIKPSKKPQKKVDESFGVKVTYWSEPVTFTIPFNITGKNPTVSGTVTYQGCNDVIETCTPPTKFEFNIPVE